MNKTVSKRVDAGRLIELVGHFGGRRVAVLGDLVADEFVYGDIARISREAPVPILEQRKTVVVPGGGGNAVANLRALGARPLPVGVVGNDSSGNSLLRAFRSSGVRVSHIIRDREYRTPTKSRILAGGIHTRRQQIVRVDRGGGSLPTGFRPKLKRHLRSALTACDGLLVADYGYGAAAPAILQGVAAARRCPVFVDSRQRVLEYRGFTACTPNQEELEQAVPLTSARGSKALEAAGRSLLRKTDAQAVLLTRGAEGMTLFERGSPTIPIPAFGSDEVADVTGAGDTVIAVFTLALLSGGDFADAAHLANYAAGLVVMKAGTATVTVDEIVAAIKEDGEC